MILTGHAIQNAVNDGKITIAPFKPDLMNPNSYNYRLGKTILEFTDDIIDPKKSSHTKEVVIPSKGYVLQPNRLYLGSTYEKIGSSHFVPSLIGRSSLGRLGLFLQITADLGHLGTQHCWTLELKCVQPLRVYPLMRIGQVSFWQPSGHNLLEATYLEKQGNYAQYSEPQTSDPNKFK